MKAGTKITYLGQEGEILEVVKRAIGTTYTIEYTTRSGQQRVAQGIKANKIKTR